MTMVQEYIGSFHSRPGDKQSCPGQVSSSEKDESVVLHTRRTYNSAEDLPVIKNFPEKYVIEVFGRIVVSKTIF